MRDCVDPVADFLEFTRAFFCKLVIDLVLRHCSRLVGSVFSPMDAISISSDDSDLREIDNYQEDESPLRDSASSRVLPSWATDSRPFQKVPSPTRPSFLNGGSSNYHSNRSLQPPTIIDDSGPSSSRAVKDVMYFSGNGNNDNWKNFPQQTLKRTLPTSLQPSDVPGSSQTRQSAWASSSSGGDNYRKGNHNELVLYENKGSRVLPPSLMHRKATSGVQYTSVNDTFGTAEERVAAADERLIFQAALQDLNQPKVEARLPEGLLSVSLLRHQRIALAWMLQKETGSVHCSGGILADDQGLGKTISMIALIQMQRSAQDKSKAKDVDAIKAEALNLDDDDESVAPASQETNQCGEIDGVEVIPDARTSIKEFRRRRPAAGTLVVCPASIVRQWARELDEKVTVDARLSILVYHGGSRTKNPAELAQYDVVLTTYAIVTNEVPKQALAEEDDDDQKNGERYGISSDFSSSKKRKKPSSSKKGKKGRKGFDLDDFDPNCGTLSKVSWFRVILDEAQTIKNHRTQVARACCSLRAKRRWCLSGTPIQNAIDELFSYFRFLRYDPYAEYKSFCSQIKFPIAINSINGYKKLQAILRAIMLRRTKGTVIDGEPIITLPPKTIQLKKVAFSAEERAFYNKLEAESRSQFKAYAAAGTVRQNYANILLMLLRLRQACDHPKLVKRESYNSVGRASSEMAKKLPKEMVENLLKQLETSLATCSVCDDVPEDAVVTMCGHVFCNQCVSDYLTGEDNTCPTPGCREQLGPEAVYSKATLKKCVSDDVNGDPSALSEFDEKSITENAYNSSKIRTAIEILESCCKSKDPYLEQDILVQCNGDSSNFGRGDSESQAKGPVKAIVFSQWTGMLNLVERALNQSGFHYERLDGTMSLAARDRAVKEFNTNPEVTVMLMSLKAGNLGLNMVAASHVILLDLWWNPTTEDQAIDRAHRIGQTRAVTVSRLTVKDTVEDRILALQEDKRNMVASAFGEDKSGGTASRLTVEDLRYLFNL
ncbi:helicase-like transcription factor CHR28 isoform X1 [Lycium ferocissimum]|uniref:helicase-like transcription factor CHR28 isoform X1 n=2 Tax=Lycium ferocissimum TaxID=112874 RepID=UPI002815522E|nr:helicase-like transcription factor CHR28 isoform X1 [Lycium ferocissimum]XP_059278875.1 helicase-like transcription factor CHR28 isoform X1 [Lycium ferocissimum]